MVSAQNQYLLSLVPFSYQKKSLQENYTDYI